ncbi:MAG: hypothetical protein LBR81_05570 [Prevotellaceae bacterium]|nr:hypothetical protein [Prevotellaceae bacterium]
MKKYFLIAFIGFSLSVNAQNIIIQQNNQMQNYTGAKEIIAVGESTTRGIEKEVVDDDNIRLTNQNDFKVECIYEVHFELYKQWYKDYAYNGWDCVNGNCNPASVFDIQKGTKVLSPNVPFLLTRKNSNPETEYKMDSDGKFLKAEYSKGKAKIISCNCYKL